MKMQKKWKVITGVALASVLATGLISGTVLADDTEEDTTTATATVTPPQGGDVLEMRRGAGPSGQYIAAVSELLGLTPQEIRTAMEAGKSLSAIATEQGVTEAALVDAILEANRAALQAKVDASVITAAVMEARLAELEDVVTLAVQATDSNPFGFETGRGKMARGEGHEGEGRFGADINNDAVLDLLGMTQEEIREARQAGQSLVEIAAGQNVTEAQLVATILAEKKAVLDEKVAAGTLTQAEADEILNRMEVRIREQVNRTEAGPNNAQITRGRGQFGTGPGDREMGRGQGQGQGQGRGQGQARGNNGDCAVDDSAVTQSGLRSSRTNLPVGSETY